MYWIMSGSQTIHHPYAPNDVATSAVEVAELNTQGSLNMSIHDPERTKLHLRDPIEVYDENGLYWRGRVLNIDDSISGYTREIHCEGALAFLCDTIIPPFVFRGRPNDYKNDQDTLVKGLFHHFIDIHNAALEPDDPRAFTIGKITVTDPNDYILRSSENAMTTWEAIQTRLIDTLGGYVWLSGENLNVINYTGDFNWGVDQPSVEFGVNMIDLVQGNNADGIITALYAYGAQNETPEQKPDPAEDQYIGWYGNRVHLADAVVYQPTYERWGLIYGTAVFDDITETANLQAAATKYLQQNIVDHVEAIEVTAADLAELDFSMEKINTGTYVLIECPPLQFRQVMLCVKKETDLLDVSRTRAVMGRTPPTISQIVGGQV